MEDRLGWPRQELLAYQERKLASALQHAVGSSPYYRDTIAALVASGAALEELPILTKHALMQNFDRVVTDARLDRALLEHHLEGEDPGALLFGEFRVAATGGTTGEKGIAIFDDRAWLEAIANTLRFQKIVGIDEKTRSMGIFASSAIHISSRIGAEVRAIRPPAPRLNVLMPIEDIVAQLNLYSPEVVSTYPSFVRVLGNEQRAGRLSIKPRLIRTSAETLSQDVRDIAAEVWGATVANSYTCTEVGAMGHECEMADGLHLAEDSFVFEVVDINNKPVPNGTAGARLLVTTLTNRILPLVRYEISDIVTLATEPCRCGLPLWRISSIEGRREEMLQFSRKGGGIVEVHAHRLRSSLTRTGGVRQFQFSQLPDGLEITISLFADFDHRMVAQSVEDSLRETLANAGAEPRRIVVRAVQSIERNGPGAKERLVVARAP
ncbi:phenylacetate--CoA ligase family protein [Rhizobium grahamii]|uniref:phenylacetate--CoA ligase family protein n=1 Tax=Rhizobium grahamii TaxID=1120045 RepID=UPI001146F0FF|nr:phenylacetate--CoA ligase family protein [Rhizobium grahamii]